MTYHATTSVPITYDCKAGDQNDDVDDGGDENNDGDDDVDGDGGDGSGDHNVDMMMIIIMTYTVPPLSTRCGENISIPQPLVKIKIKFIGIERWNENTPSELNRASLGN